MKYWQLAGEYWTKYCQLAGEYLTGILMRSFRTQGSAVHSAHQQRALTKKADKTTNLREARLPQNG